MALPLVWMAMHRIDASSPLHGLSPADLSRLHAALLVAFSGVDETMERPVHVRPIPLKTIKACWCQGFTDRSLPQAVGMTPRELSHSGAS